MSEAENAVFDLLKQKGIEYEAVQHKAVYTIGEMQELGLPQMDSVAKNLFLRNDKHSEYYLLVLREEKRADLKALRRTIGSRPLTFASEQELGELLGLTAGSVTPFGVLNDRDCRVQVLIDADFAGKRIGVHPNDNTASVWLAVSDLTGLIRAHGNTVQFVKL